MTEPGQVRTVQLAERSRSPYRLGRHVQLDPRSLAFAAPVLPRSAIVSVEWTRRVGITDQGDLGACTGHAALGWLVTDNATRPGLTAVGNEAADGTYATETLYHLATTLDEFQDEWRPIDTGSSGLGAAKALKHLGLSTGYQHAFSLQAVQTALQTGPVLVGVPWYDSMFSPVEGRVPVDPESGLAGGHELCLDQLDVEAGTVGFPNSWGTGWGVDGRGFFMLYDLERLLADDGDCVIPAPVPAAPAPPEPGRAGCLGQFTRAFRR